MDFSILAVDDWQWFTRDIEYVCIFGGVSLNEFKRTGYEIQFTEPGIGVEFLFKLFKFEQYFLVNQIIINCLPVRFLELPELL